MLRTKNKNNQILKFLKTNNIIHLFFLNTKEAKWKNKSREIGEVVYEKKRNQKIGANLRKKSRGFIKKWSKKWYREIKSEQVKS